MQLISRYLFVKIKNFEKQRGLIASHSNTSLAAYERAGSSKSATLLLQLDWKSKDNDDLATPNTVRVDTRSVHRWRQFSIAVRAPAEAKYVFVSARAASGRIWVDDYSLKKIPANCEPVIFVTPNPVSVPARQVGRAAVSWNACCSAEAQVTLAINEGAEEVFARGPSGFAFLDGIKRGRRYVFRLYTEPHTPVVQKAILSTTER